jgi:hypothetical protein
MNGQTNVAYLYSEILIHKNDCVSMCRILDELCKYCAKWKKSFTKDHVFYDFIYIKCLEYTNLNR